MVSSWIFWLDLWSRQNTNHGSTKLALIFSRIEQKPARLHVRICGKIQSFLNLVRVFCRHFADFKKDKKNTGFVTTTMFLWACFGPVFGPVYGPVYVPVYKYAHFVYMVWNGVSISSGRRTRTHGPFLRLNNVIV